MRGRAANGRAVSTAVAPEVLLRRLRLRLVVLFVVVAGVGLAGLVSMLVVTSLDAERRQLDDRLRAVASRGAALTFVDPQGRVRSSAVRNDTVTSEPGGLVIVALPAEGTPDEVFATGRVGIEDTLALARRALDDEDETGSVATLAVSGQDQRAVAMPWWRDRTIGGAVVAYDDATGASSSGILVPATGGALALLALLAVTVWTIAGAMMEPATTAMAARERFLSTAAHELRRPLARLRAAAEATRREISADDPGHQPLRSLIGVADSAGTVVSNLLLATRIDHAGSPVVQRTPVRLDQVLVDLESAAESLVVDVREPIIVLGDVGLLRHALVNLIDNAVRHGRVGGSPPTIVLAAAVHRASDGEPRAVVTVRDDGPGFPPGVDVLGSYVSGPQGGTGLGLSLVRWIVDEHGGRLSLHSGAAADPGATVTVELPLLDAG